MKPRIALLFGGKSVEHEISVISGIQAFMNINTDNYDVTPVYMTKNNEMYIGSHIGEMDSYKDIPSLLQSSTRVLMENIDGTVYLLPYIKDKIKKKSAIPVDMAFPVVHGTNVEDGALQGYLKTIGLPFVGCDVTAAAIGMDKAVMKSVLKEYDIPVLDAAVYTMAEYADVEKLCQKVEEKFVYPVIVKPVNLGSSVGIQIAKDQTELIDAFDDAYRYASKVLVEPAIMNLREINCAVLGDENEAIASECEEPMRSDEILDYEDKYMRNSKGGGSKGMASVLRQIPANLTTEQRDTIRTMAVKAFCAMACNGVARIDFMMDTQTNRIYFNEINTIPGSLAFYLWEPVGISYPQLLDRMIALAFKRARTEESLTFTFQTNILSQAGLGGVKGK